jgi:surface antigen
MALITIIGGWRVRMAALVGHVAIVEQILENIKIEEY